MIPTSDAKKRFCVRSLSVILTSSQILQVSVWKPGMGVRLDCQVFSCAAQVSFLVVRPFRLRGHVTFSTVCYTILCDIHLFSEPDWNRHCDLNLEDLAVQNFSAWHFVKWWESISSFYARYLIENIARMRRRERREGGVGGVTDGGVFDVTPPHPSLSLSLSSFAAFLWGVYHIIRGRRVAEYWIWTSCQPHKGCLGG